jgi:hypothetical protein
MAVRPLDPWSHDQVEVTRRKLIQTAAQQVAQGRKLLRYHKPAPALPLQVLDPMSPGVYSFVNTSVLLPSHIHLMLHEGIVLYEPFGGMCSGLEAVLRLGFKIQCYLYSDISPVACKVAASRVQSLISRYSSQLDPAAVASMYNLPQDVRQIGKGHLQSAVVKPSERWMVVAGWECQDLSPAGSGKGLEGSKSRTF